MSKTELIVIAGPTACGKTAVSVRLAELIDGEIISADSMQVYRGMNIGTAKITPEEMHGIPHYLIDEFDPDEDFNVAIFQQLAKKYMECIHKKGKMPIVAGGTGFYINALVFDNDFSQPQAENSIREELYRLAEEKGIEYMHKMLENIDPDSAKAIHMNNLKKVIRAIEFYKINGRCISAHNVAERQRRERYNTKIFVLNMDRKRLYERIEKRIDIMLEQGLLDEVEGLLKKYSPQLVSMQGLGYKEFVPYFNGECSLDESVGNLKTATRHFAKRQLTWFKNRCPQAIYVDMDKFDTENAAKFIALEI